MRFVWVKHLMNWRVGVVYEANILNIVFCNRSLIALQYNNLCSFWSLNDFADIG